MATLWVYREIIFVPEAKQNAANDEWGVGVDRIDPDTGGNQTFVGVRLSGDGEEPATHFACNTALMGEMKAKVDDAATGLELERYDVYVDGGAFGTACTDMGLYLIEEE